MAKAPSRHHVEMTSRDVILQKYIWAEKITSIVKDLIRFSALVLIFRYSYMMIDALAGRQTQANINVLGQFKVSDALAWMFGASGVGYGLLQRRLRRQTAERMGSRNKELEKRLDSGRSSSNLGPGGLTRPEDEK